MASNDTPYPNTQYTPEQQQRNRRTSYIALGSLGGLLVLCCVIAGIVGAVSNAAGSGHANATATTHNQQQVVHKSSPQATAPPTVLPATLPTVNVQPIATPDVQAELTRIAQNAAAQESATFVGMTFGDGRVFVKVDEGEQLTSGLAQEGVKIIVFAEMKALFTSNLPVTEVDIMVTGPVQDAYGNTSTGEYGEAQLSLATAQLFNWDNLEQDSAWQVYDFTFLHP